MKEEETDCKSQRLGRADSKPCLLDVDGTVALVNPQQPWLPAHGRHQREHSQYPSMEQGGAHGPPLLSEKLLTVDVFWGREKSVFFKGEDPGMDGSLS